MKRIGTMGAMFIGSRDIVVGKGDDDFNPTINAIKIGEEKIWKGETDMNKLTGEHYLDSVKEMQIGAIGEVTEPDNNYKPPTMRSNIKKRKRR